MSNKDIDSTATVALLHCQQSETQFCKDTIFRCMAEAGIAPSRGSVVLVKPNLLLANPLVCTDAFVVGCVCSYLLDIGVKVLVSDSPGFGSLFRIAHCIGLDRQLAKYTIPLVPMTRSVWKETEVLGKRVSIPIARTALECDSIVSVPKVKVHRQMLLSLAVKNCFGCIPGLHKAFIHTLYGAKRSFFAGYIAALYELLPPVAAVADGICAMHVTGPSGGKSYPLHLVGSSLDAAALDMALYELFGLTCRDVPLGDALLQRFSPACQADQMPVHLFYPLDTPGSWQIPDFSIPKELMTTSFAPHRLFLSCCKRIKMYLFDRLTQSR